MKLTPEQAIKQEILTEIKLWEKDHKIKLPLFNTPDEIENAWEIAEINDLHWDAVSEFRCSYDTTTNIKCDFSRHYESKSVAKQLSNGQWVGWTYWYGGGKHGQPEEMEWMEWAYFLECKEREELIIVWEFKKVEE